MQDTVKKAQPKNEKSSLLHHIAALRKVLLISVSAVLVGFVVFFYFLCTPVMEYILAPIEARNISLVYTAMSEALTTQLKLSVIGALVITFPVILWQVWSFIKPALYEKERKSFRRWFWIALLLFLGGVAFCYFTVYKLAINFFIISGEGLATPMLSIDKYLSFLLSFLLPFGLSFELPVVVYLTTRMGLTTAAGLCKARKYVILGIAIIAAILTPPDVVSQVMLGIPMVLLYEAGVFIAKRVKPGEGR